MYVIISPHLPSLKKSSQKDSKKDTRVKPRLIGKAHVLEDCTHFHLGGYFNMKGPKRDEKSVVRESEGV